MDAANKGQSARNADYRVYRITSPNHKAVIIFARDIVDAARVALRFQNQRNLAEVKITIDPGWASTLVGVGKAHIEEARRMCRQPSIARRYRADCGWGLSPAPGDDEL